MGEAGKGMEGGEAVGKGRRVRGMRRRRLRSFSTSGPYFLSSWRTWQNPHPAPLHPQQSRAFGNERKGWSFRMEDQGLGNTVGILRCRGHLYFDRDKDVGEERGFKTGALKWGVRI